MLAHANDPRLEQARKELDFWISVYFITDAGDPRGREVLGAVFKAYLFIRLLERILTDMETDSYEVDWTSSL